MKNWINNKEIEQLRKHWKELKVPIHTQREYLKELQSLDRQQRRSDRKFNKFTISVGTSETAQNMALEQMNKKVRVTKYKTDYNLDDEK